MLENGSEICNCKRVKCGIHGKCSECIDHHEKAKKKSLPFCKRVKKTKSESNGK